MGPMFLQAHPRLALDLSADFFFLRGPASIDCAIAAAAAN